MHTILGSGGAVGLELAKALPKYTENIRLVSRNPKKVNHLTNAHEVEKAIEGSEIVYVTIGFPYKFSTWQQCWPPFVKSVIEGYKKHKAKLVFFDNIYMYDVSAIGNITEDAPINPPSKKRKIRSEIATMITDAMADGSVNALIAQAADFYGPGIKNTSVLTETVFNNFFLVEKPQIGS